MKAFMTLNPNHKNYQAESVFLSACTRIQGWDRHQSRHFLT
jgi:hypothetical protein